MNELLPPEILKQILNRLDPVDLDSAYNTCIFWKNVIDEHGLWLKREKQWLQLVQLAKKSFIGVKFDDLNIYEWKSKLINPKEAFYRLKNILLCKDEKRRCLFRYYDIIKHNIAIIKINTVSAHISSFMHNKFRTPGDFYNRIHNKVLPLNINELFFLNKQHLHLKMLYFLYPMEINGIITKEFIKYLFEEVHANRVIFIPIVLLCSISFKYDDCIIVYTQTTGTEIAIIINNQVSRWRKLPFCHDDLDDNKYPMKYIRCMTKTGNGTKPFGKVVKRHFEKRPKIDDDLFEKEPNSPIEEGPRIFLIPDEFYKKINLANTINSLLDGLSDETIHLLLQSVFLVGSYHDLAFIDQKLKNDLVELYPAYNYDIMVYVEKDSTIYDSFSESYLSDELPTKYVQGSAYTINIEDYIFKGVDDL